MQQMPYPLKPRSNGRCTDVIENSKIGMSRHLGSSTTTQVAQTMVDTEQKDSNVGDEVQCKGSF